VETLPDSELPPGDLYFCYLDIKIKVKKIFLNVIKAKIKIPLD
jgi:hypothetical protein